MNRFLSLGFALLWSTAAVGQGAAPASLPGVYTKAFDNARSGSNPNETILTRNAVATKGIVLQTTIPVIGDARGEEAQPLIQPGVLLSDGTTQDVMILPSMANVVRGVNAETGVGIWQSTLCMPIQGSAAIDMHMINDKWGVLSTGVIDPATQKVYMVAWCSDDGSGSPQTARHHAYVLSIPTGAIIGNTVVAGTSGTQVYASDMRKQRSALLLTNVGGVKTVFWASGTVLETSNGAAGWVFAFDTYDNQIKASLALSQGLGAGVWMGSQGMAADSKGYLYGISGNGSFNGSTDFGESVFKLAYTSPTSTNAATLKVYDWWSPFSDAGREGQNPTLSAPAVEQPSTTPEGASALTQEMTPRPVGASMRMPLKTRTVQGGPTLETGSIATLVYPLANAGVDAAWSDEDLGAGGGTLDEAAGVYYAAGKDGLMYPVNSTNMGKTQSADFANPKANCAKLAAVPVWFTTSPGPVDPCPTDVTTLNFLPWGKTRHMHATPVQYNSPTFGKALIGGGENSQVHEWLESSTGVLTYKAEGQEIASSQVTNSPGGMPGTFCTLSSNQNAGAVLWCSQPYGDANATITGGHLIAYDPETMATLWDSGDWNIGFTFNKFSAPIAWNGRVYLPDYSGGVLLFSLTGN